MYPFKQSVKPLLNNVKVTGKDEPLQWPLNPSAYQNVCNDEIDWAALAQQWIYMKETCPYEGMPEAPPPPNISNSISRKAYEEKGEAPMEVEKDDEQLTENAVFAETMNPNFPGNDPLMENKNSNNWGAPGWSSHGWRKSETIEFLLLIIFLIRKTIFLKEPGWNTWTNPNNNLAPSSSQTAMNEMRHQPPLLPDPNMFNDIDLRTGDGYWTANQRFPVSKDSHIQSSLNLDDQSPKSNSESQSEPFSLDAAKRKTLPAWIR